MILVALDTATPSTVAGVLDADGRVTEARDDPPAGARGDHAGKLLVLVEQALAEAGVGWGDVERIAVGVGPGGFTGLRIGVASARALAQARGLPLVPVSSLAALAAGATGTVPGARTRCVAGATGTVLRAEVAVAAVIDARRGEVFAGVWAGADMLLAPAALAPEALAARLLELALPVQAVGDGAVRFSAELEAAGAAVPVARSAVHRIAAAPLCRLGAEGDPAERDRLLPDYRREPDAKPPQ